MKNSKTLLTVLLLSIPSLLPGVYEQTGSTSSATSLAKIPSQRKLAQMRAGSGQTPAADKQT